MGESRVGKLQVDAQTMGRARDAVNRNASIRNAIIRLIEGDAQRIVDLAVAVAQTDLHNDRPANRRSPATYGRKHYINSFTVRYFDSPSLENVRMEIRNDSPVAHIIEWGSAPHQIPLGSTATGRPLRFPTFFPSPQSRGSVGHKGQWALQWTDGRIMEKYVVEHPGTPARHILRRAMDRYRRQVRKERDLHGR